MTRRVLLAGEGKSELGGWSAAPGYRDDSPMPGVLEALLRQVSPDGFKIAHAIQWKNLTFYRTPGRLAKDELNTQALWLIARDHHCDLIVFSRDRDGDKERQIAVQSGISWLEPKVAGTDMTIVGSVAIECIEAWVLAFMGERRTEGLGRVRPKQVAMQRGLGDASGLAQAIQSGNLSNVPEDAASLNTWLASAKRAFSMGS